MKGIQCYPELLVLLWHCLDANKEFLGHLLRSPHAMEIAVPCVYFLVDSRRDPARIGVVHIAIFTLLLLSGEREFCVALNRPCATRLPTDLPLFAGTHGDLVVLAIHKARAALKKREIYIGARDSFRWIQGPARPFQKNPSREISAF
eukprot:tig00000361_g24375.t1